MKWPGRARFGDDDWLREWLILFQEAGKMGTETGKFGDFLV